MPIEIDEGVELPSLKRGSGKDPKYPLADMKIADLLAALKEAVQFCSACDGIGTVRSMTDETEICQPPGSSERGCTQCAGWRAAIAQAAAPETVAERNRLKEVNAGLLAALKLFRPMFCAPADFSIADVWNAMEQADTAIAQAEQAEATP